MTRKEKLAEERVVDKRLFKTTKDVVLHTMYLFLLVVLASDAQPSNGYYQRKAVEQWSEEAIKDGLKLDDIYSLMEKSVFPCVYPLKDIYGNVLSAEDQHYVYNYQGYRFMPLYMRQLRVKPERCSTVLAHISEKRLCTPPLSQHRNEDRHFNSSWKSPYDTRTHIKPKSVDPLQDSFIYSPKGTYSYQKSSIYSLPSGGYYANFGPSHGSALKLLGELKKHSWLDRYTSVVIIETVIYSPNVNLFTIFKILIEKKDTGELAIVHSAIPLRLYSYVGENGLLLLMAQAIWGLLLFYRGINMAIQLLKHPKKYFQHLWNGLDLICELWGLVSVALFVAKALLTVRMVEKINNNMSMIVNMDILLFLDDSFRFSIAMTIFLSILITMKYLKLVRHIAIVSRAMRRFLQAILSYIGFLVILGIAFSLMGYLFIGHIDKDFSSVVSAYVSLLIATFGMSRMRKSIGADGVSVGLQSIIHKIYMMLYAVSMLYIIVNMFISIITEAYSTIREDGDYEYDSRLASHFEEKVHNTWNSFISFINESLGINDRYISQKPVPFKGKQRGVFSKHEWGFYNGSVSGGKGGRGAKCIKKGKHKIEENGCEADPDMPLDIINVMKYVSGELHLYCDHLALKPEETRRPEQELQLLGDLAVVYGSLRDQLQFVDEQIHQCTTNLVRTGIPSLKR